AVWPAATSLGTSTRPRSPVPPVTSTFISDRISFRPGDDAEARDVTATPGLHRGGFGSSQLLVQVGELVRVDDGVGARDDAVLDLDGGDVDELFADPDKQRGGAVDFGGGIAGAGRREAQQAGEEPQHDVAPDHRAPGGDG